VLSGLLPRRQASVANAEHSAAVLGVLKTAGFQTIIIDLPPTPMEPISRAIEAADFVVIPTRVGPFDVSGIRPVIGLCQDLRRPFLFVLAATNPEAPG
jgi:cellulose biosynthesis protein BcsQ